MERITYYIKKLWSYVKPSLASFSHGLLWPFTWLESQAASFGLLVSIFILIAVASVSGIIAISYVADLGSSSDTTPTETSSSVTSSDSSTAGTGSSNTNCNVVGIEIRGCILTYRPDSADSILGSGEGSCDAITSSEAVTWALEGAANNPKIKAVVLQIDSGGGSPAAAEEIVAGIKALGKPSFAWVRESAGSAAYWIASAADAIIASESSDIGSIGVTYSYVDNAKQNLKDGLTYNQLIAGRYKDIGTTDRALTADERSLIQRDLDILHKNFINAIATNRNLSVAKVTALADGSSMLGRQALRNGLIDQLGTRQEVWKRVEAEINEKPEVCWP